MKHCYINRVPYSIRVFDDEILIVDSMYTVPTLNVHTKKFDNHCVSFKLDSAIIFNDIRMQVIFNFPKLTL